MNTPFSEVRNLEKDAKRLGKFCRKQIKKMISAGMSPEDILLETIDYVPLPSMGPITKEDAYAILFLETKRRITACEELHCVH